MLAMFATTCYEAFLLCWQVSAIIANAQALCDNPVVPVLGMNCPAGAISLIEVSNWAFLLLYLYFTGVCYEYYLQGCSSPSLIKKQVLEEEREKAKK